VNAVVAGFGSIGARHARVLEELGCRVTVVSRRGEVTSVASVAGKADYIVVANETSEHCNTVREIAATGFEGTVLVEKPLFDAPEDVPDHRFEHAYVGYNMRFHPLTQQLREFAMGEQLLTAHAYVGQHLTTWRPGSDYRQSYSASRARGGGVLRDLSHEIDTLRWLLGDLTLAGAAGGHFSSLEIDSDDVFALLMKGERCPVATLQMNYVDRRTRRELMLVAERDTLHADYVAAKVDRDYTYREMHRAALAGDDSRLASFADGMAVLRLIEEAEKSTE